MVYSNENKFFNRNFFLRTCSTLVLAPLVLLIIHIGGFIYYLTIVAMAALMAFEWHEMLQSKLMKRNWLWQLFAVIYIAAPCTSLIWIMMHDHGPRIVTWLVLIIAITDIAAYLCGRTIGGPKLAPRISPGKTWSGLIGGCSFAVLFGFAAGTYYGTNHLHILMTLTLILALYAQIGDLIESWVKRKFEIKDSGSLIPGHGGILDRVDGIILTAPKVALILMFDHHWQLF